MKVRSGAPMNPPPQPPTITAFDKLNEKLDSIKEQLGSIVQKIEVLELKPNEHMQRIIEDAKQQVYRHSGVDLSTLDISTLDKVKKITIAVCPYCDCKIKLGTERHKELEAHDKASINCLACDRLFTLRKDEEGNIFTT